MPVSIQAQAHRTETSHHKMRQWYNLHDAVMIGADSPYKVLAQQSYPKGLLLAGM